MVVPIPIYIATEDELSEQVIIRLVESFDGKFNICSLLRQNGFGYLKSSIRKFIDLSNRFPVIVLTDLDMKTCPPALRDDWFGSITVSNNFLFCVAVREVEAWLLADNEGLSSMFGLKHKANIPNVEGVIIP